MEQEILNSSPKSTEILFRPVTEGLGFHPFSDGLPYAPIAKTPNIKVQTQPPFPPLSKPPAPIPQVPPTQASKPVFSPPQTSLSSAPAPSVSVPRVSFPIAAQKNKTGFPHHSSMTKVERNSKAPDSPYDMDGLEEKGYVYLTKRILAYSIDFVLNISFCWIFLTELLWKQNFNPDLLTDSSVLIVGAFVLLISHWILLTIQEVLFKTSLGKRLFGLAFKSDRLTLLVRAFFFIFSVGFGGFGLLWSLFDSERRCWHDVATRTQPL